MDRHWRSSRRSPMRHGRTICILSTNACCVFNGMCDSKTIRWYLLIWIREWSYFNLNKACPYRFSDEEISIHQDETKNFNDNQRLWQNLRGLLTDDGYTTNEDYPQAVKVLRELQESFLKAATPSKATWQWASNPPILRATPCSIRGGSVSVEAARPSNLGNCKSPV